MLGVIGIGAQEIILLGILCVGALVPIAIVLLVVKAANKPKPPSPRDIAENDEE
jgi:hypothetical protein